jgi:hypothetical protein
MSCRKISRRSPGVSCFVEVAVGFLRFLEAAEFRDRFFHISIWHTLHEGELRDTISWKLLRHRLAGAADRGGEIS